MARAVHAQLSAFYTWALPRLDRLQSNPCRDAGRPAKGKARDRVLSNEELRALWIAADGEGFPWGPAFKLMMLTGARRKEVFNADRSEFDLKAGEWTIPPARSKNDLAHKGLVSLSTVYTCSPAHDRYLCIGGSDYAVELFGPLPQRVPFFGFPVMPLINARYPALRTADMIHDSFRNFEAHAKPLKPGSNRPAYIVHRPVGTALPVERHIDCFLKPCLCLAKSA